MRPQVYQEMMEGLLHKLVEKFTHRYSRIRFYVSTTGCEPKLRLGVSYFDGPHELEVEQVLDEYVAGLSEVFRGDVTRMPSDDTLAKAEKMWRDGRREGGLNPDVSVFMYYGQGLAPAITVEGVEIPENFPRYQVLDIAKRVVFETP